MRTEYEAKFLNIDKSDIRQKLKQTDATLVKPEFIQKRIPFHLPNDTKTKDAWLRVRDEGDKITLSFKKIVGHKIEDQKEICLIVDNFENAVQFLKSIGCNPKSYQETKREIWKLDGAEITIDEWPFLEPFVEIEGDSEKIVQEVSKKIGFDYEKALFCAVGSLYKMKYGIHPDEINTVEKIVFDMNNPFTAK